MRLTPITVFHYLQSSLGPKTNPSADHFQYCIILKVIYAPDEVWGRDYLKSYFHMSYTESRFACAFRLLQ